MLLEQLFCVFVFKKDNEAGDKGACALGDALQANTTLTTLKVYGEQKSVTSGKLSDRHSTKGPLKQATTSAQEAQRR